MAQKIVSFEVAKALKEAGYPQLNTKKRYTTNGAFIYCMNLDDVHNTQYDAPTYLDAWLWLWREKKECINIMTDIHGDCRTVCNNGDVMPKYLDPEEAIVKAVDYLVENNLIK